MTTSSAGSHWHKWDLHIHAPSCALNNQFRGATSEEKWAGYLECIEAVPDVSVLGITDYFSIEGYQLLLVEKQAGRFPKVDLLIPNVELRIIPVTGESNPINLHVLFDPDPAVVNNLGTYFFQNLEFTYAGNNYRCTRDDLIRLGRAYKGDQGLDDSTAYKEGVNQFKITHKQLGDVLRKNKHLSGKYLIGVSNSSSDGNSGRLRGFSTSNAYKSAVLSAWGAKFELRRFLARRCSKEFLSLYLDENPDLVDRVSEPGLYAYSEIHLAVRLHELGLLPENKRNKFVATVSEYAVRGDDLYALDDVDIRSVFEDHEFEELLENVRTQLLSRLSDVRIDWQLNRESSKPPDEHMQQLLDSFETLKKHFGDDTDAAAIVEQETRLSIEWIAENTTEEPDRKPRALGKVETLEKPPGTRSIFEDVDA